MGTAFAVQQVKPEKMNRKGFIGGSDIAAILGISPWKTAYELWEEKTTDWQEASSEERDKVLRRGKKLEPMVIEMLQEEHDVWVLDRNQIHVDEEYPFLRAEIDFEYSMSYIEAGGSGVHEIGNGDVKTVHPMAARDWGEQGTDEFPAYHGAQFQHGLGVTKRTHTKVGALIGADDLRVYEVDRDEDLIAYIRKTSVDFWFNHVIAGVPPGIQSSEDASKVLSRFEGFAWTGNEEVWKQLDILKGVKEAQKRLEATRDGLEIAVKTALANAATDRGVEGDSKKFAILGPDGKPAVTWNSQQTNRIAVKLLRAEHPDIAELFTETTTTRVLRTK
jgi:putative phage-type endonuclease